MNNPKNIKILTDDELRYLKEKYYFEITQSLDGSKYIAVKTSTCNRKVLHDASKTFTINTAIKRVSITSEAVSYWQLLPEYDLFTIQNTINILLITYQEISKDEIIKQIKINRIKILQK